MTLMEKSTRMQRSPLRGPLVIWVMALAPGSSGTAEKWPEGATFRKSFRELAIGYI